VNPGERSAIVLAAGSGSRLRPFTDYLCKALLPLYDRTLVQNAVSFLESQGIARAHVVCEHRYANALREHLGDHENVEIVPIAATRGPAESLLLGLDQVAPSATPVAYWVDNVFQGAIETLMQAPLDDNRCEVLLAYHAEPWNFDVPIWDPSSGRVVGIGAGAIAPASHTVFTGCMRLPIDAHSTLAEIVRRGAFEIRDLWRHYLALGRLECTTFLGDWTDAGYSPDALFSAGEMVRRGWNTHAFDENQIT
jgi:glucose-1-phosphate thymidylyltransferase